MNSCAPPMDLQAIGEAKAEPYTIVVTIFALERVPGSGLNPRGWPPP